MSSALQWIISHIQPISEWHISVAWLPLIIGFSTIFTYLWAFPEAPFTNDIHSLFNRIIQFRFTLSNFLNLITFGYYDRIVYYLVYPVVAVWYSITWIGGGIKDLGIFSWNCFKSFCRWIGGSTN